MSKVNIKTHAGYKIEYDPDDKLFYLYDADGNELATAGTQQKIEAEITALSRQTFKLPIPAISTGYCSVSRGRITSVNLQRGSAYFAYDDKARGRTEKLSLRWDHNHFVLTEANEIIVSQIETLIAQRKEIESKVEALKQQFQSPINSAYFGKGD